MKLGTILAEEAAAETAKSMYTKQEDRSGLARLVGGILVASVITKMAVKLKRWVLGQKVDTGTQLREMTVAKLASDGPVQLEVPPSVPVVLNVGGDTLNMAESVTLLSGQLDALKQTVEKDDKGLKEEASKTSMLLAAIFGETVENNRQQWLRNRRIDRERRRQNVYEYRREMKSGISLKAANAKAKASEAASGIMQSIAGAIGGTMLGKGVLKVGGKVLGLGGKLLGAGGKLLGPAVARGAGALAARGGIAGLATRAGGTMLKAGAGLVMRHPIAAALTAAGIGGYSLLMGKLPKGGPEQDFVTNVLGLGMMSDKGGVGSALGTAASWAATGAALGTAFPVIGTAVGATTGAIVGGLVGWMGKDWWKSWFSDPEGTAKKTASKVDDVLKASLEDSASKSVRNYTANAMSGNVGPKPDVVPSDRLAAGMANRVYDANVTSAAESRAAARSVAAAAISNTTNVNNINNSIIMRTRPWTDDPTARRVRDLITGVR